MLDSDAAKKICQYVLLDELISAFDCSLEDLAILPQLNFQLKLLNNHKALNKLGSDEAVAQARRLVSDAHEVQIQVATANSALLLSRPDIDSGEAALFAALLSDVESNLVSGDKRAFVALSKIDGQPVDALWTRVLCLEETMFIMLRTVDFQYISEKIRARLDVDSAMSNAFGRTQANSKQDVSEALQSYIRSLVDDTSGKYQFVQAG